MLRSECIQLLQNKHGEFCLYIYMILDCKTQLEDLTPPSELELSDHNQLLWQRQISDDNFKKTLEAASPLQ